MMGHIYSCSSRVLVWLGVSYDTRQLVTRDRICQQALQIDAPASDSTLDEICALAPNGPEHMNRALTEIISSPWFSRAWVFQEVTLPLASKLLFPLYNMYMAEPSWTVLAFDLVSFSDSMRRFPELAEGSETVRTCQPGTLVHKHAFACSKRNALPKRAQTPTLAVHGELFTHRTTALQSLTHSTYDP
ncbi:hypothetical protein EK21DRAFT_94932 [Setomelanomma holmii]|uniref:Heterokaryon incompatibility domain-containing protein n=1 Tax=Setomelanomma holmii TaxID=210430 RepID=A0A9P4LFP4_9PLEO|nr:hypothetical protein EK21DRAFT_94932 [Setomelanomma holmii]